MDDDAKKALAVLAALEQEHNEHFEDERPLFAINGAMVRMGDVRAAKRALVADVSRETSPVLAEAFPPPGLDMEAWAEWIRYRTERRLAKYRVTATMKLSRWLAAKPAAEQRAIIDQSIRNNWQGLFEHKGAINGHAGSSRYDRLGQEFEGKAAGVLSVEPPAANVRHSLAGPVRHGTERPVDPRRR